MNELLAEQVDRLITVEMRLPGFIRGIIPALYERARKKFFKPLTLLAAESLLHRINPGDTVFIATGAGGPPWLPNGETDGPLGAAALARSLDLAFGATAVYVTEDWGAKPMFAVSQAAGLTVMDYDSAKGRPHAAAMVCYPQDENRAEMMAAELLDRCCPSCIFAVEKMGPNEKGVIHSALGRDFTKPHARVDLLFKEAKARGILTIGIGDSGNEIGFGTIAEDVKQVHPYGGKCQCPCGAGIADSTVTDILIVANISNWGAYGVCALLSALLERPEVLHNAQIERRMIEECVRAGAFDGVLSWQVMSVDGLPIEIHEAIVSMLGCMVSNELRTLKRDF